MKNRRSRRRLIFGVKTFSLYQKQKPRSVRSLPAISTRSRLATSASVNIGLMAYSWDAGGHHAVCHSGGEYARGEAHVNSAESYFSLLDRGIMGTFHHVSDKHLDRYCNEFSFRWNHRKVKDGKRTSAAVRGFDGKRLEYRTLIGRA